VSDLQCPARFHLVRYDGLEGPKGDALGGERIARVYTPALLDAVRAGESAAAEVGVRAQVLDGLTTAEVVGASLLPVLDDIADELRGESVVVMTSGESLRASSSFAEAEPGEHVVLERDVDGWRLG